LARSGFEVTLIERDSIAAHASGQNAGNLNPLHGTPVELLEFALEAFQIHGSVRAELNEMGCANYELLPVKRIFLGCDATDRTQLEATFVLFNATAGFSARWLDGDSLRELEPRLERKISFGILTTGSLSVESCDFTRSLASAAVRLGASILHQRAIGIAISRDRVTGIQTDAGTIACDQVVFATGPWVADLHSWLGVDLAIEPVKGELLLLQMGGEMIQHDLTLEQACLYRRRDDQVWVGSTMRDCGHECAPSEEAKESLMEGAARILPDIRNAKLLKHVAALRPMAASGPIAERASGWQNVYIGNGGGTKGLLLSVGIARKIREILVHGRIASERTSLV
jgi:glycine/D-amino acid oxidase-like deaminating enzyme